MTTYLRVLMLYIIPDGWLPGHTLLVENAEGRLIARAAGEWFRYRKHVHMQQDDSTAAGPADFILEKAFWTNTYKIMKADEEPVFEITKSSFFRERYVFSVKGLSFELRKAGFMSRHFELFRVDETQVDSRELIAQIQPTGFFSRSWEIETFSPLPEWLQICIVLTCRIIYQQQAAAAGS